MEKQGRGREWRSDRVVLFSSKHRDDLSDVVNAFGIGPKLQWLSLAHAACAQWM